MPPENNSKKKEFGYTLTFSKKNQDAKNFIDQRKSEGQKFTDYVCEAVRFYEKHKEKGLDQQIEEIVDKKLNEKFALFIGNIQAFSNLLPVNNSESAITQDEPVNLEEKKDLESDLDEIDIDED